MSYPAKNLYLIKYALEKHSYDIPASEQWC